MIGKHIAVRWALLCALGAALVAPGAAHADDLTDPVARAYKIEVGGLRDSAKTPPPWTKSTRDGLFSARLAALFARDEKYMAEAEGVGLLDWDPFINGQDGEVKSLAFKAISRSAAKGAVEATFTSFGTRQNILFDMVQEKNAWRIDDIRPRDEKGKRSSIAAILSGKHECGSATGRKC